MAIDLATLRKLESLPASAQSVPRGGSERLSVIVRLRKGSERPSYVEPRAEISPEIFTAVIAASDLRVLEGDPAVEAVSISRELPNIR